MSGTVQFQPISVERSSVADAIYNDILNAVATGDLVPGTRLNDLKMAEQLGISRTPVREALQRLRDIGVVEAAAYRYTRIAEVTPQKVRNNLTVWLALAAPLLREVIPQATKQLVPLLKADNTAFKKAAKNRDVAGVASANFNFFARFVSLSTNDALVRGIDNVIHVIRLGSLTLPEWVDIEKLMAIQDSLIEAATTHDVSLALKALDTLSGLAVPGESISA
jgi:DNA-binding GntR family transcriptional regulator